MPNDTISFAVTTMEVISASAEDSAGTSCFLEKNLIQHPRYTKIAPDTESKPQDASQKETISLDFLREDTEVLAFFGQNADSLIAIS